MLPRRTQRGCPQLAFATIRYPDPVILLSLSLTSLTSHLSVSRVHHDVE